MTRPSLILVSPNIERKGDEFGDLSISLSETYQKALGKDSTVILTSDSDLFRLFKHMDKPPAQ